MKISAKAGLLFLSAISSNVHGSGDGTQDVAPTLSALAHARTAAIRVTDETSPGCWDRRMHSHEGMIKRLRWAGFDIVTADEHPDLLLVVSPKGTRGNGSICEVELMLTLHINSIGTIDYQTSGGGISAIVGASAGSRKGMPHQINQWIQEQADIFAEAVVFACHDAKRILGESSYRWRLKGLSHELISSPDAVQRHIDLCGGDGRFWRIRSGARYVDMFFIKCMRDLTYEVAYDEATDPSECVWLNFPTSSRGRSRGYHGELICRSAPPNARQSYSLTSPQH